MDGPGPGWQRLAIQTPAREEHSSSGGRGKHVHGQGPQSDKDAIESGRRPPPLPNSSRSLAPMPHISALHFLKDVSSAKGSSTSAAASTSAVDDDDVITPRWLRQPGASKGGDIPLGDSLARGVPQKTPLSGRRAAPSSTKFIDNNSSTGMTANNTNSITNTTTTTTTTTTRTAPNLARQPQPMQKPDKTKSSELHQADVFQAATATCSKHAAAAAAAAAAVIIGSPAVRALEHEDVAERITWWLDARSMAMMSRVCKAMSSSIQGSGGGGRGGGVTCPVEQAARSRAMWMCKSVPDADLHLMEGESWLHLLRTLEGYSQPVERVCFASAAASNGQSGHTALLSQDGGVWTMGKDNSDGRLGHGDLGPRETPHRVGLIPRCTSVSVGGMSRASHMRETCRWGANPTTASVGFTPRGGNYDVSHAGDGQHLDHLFYVSRRPSAPF
jgi:hypothetical protein